MTQALILAAGRGTRLGPHTDDRPKCLTPVGERTILEHQLRGLESVGVSGIVIVTGFRHDVLEAAIAQRRFARDVPVRFEHNPDFAMTNVLASWRIAAPVMAEDYIYLHGDTVFEPAVLHTLLAARRPAMTLACDPHECAEEEMKVSLDGDRVLRISKQLAPTDTDGEFTGVLHCPLDVHRRLIGVAETLLSNGESRRTMFFEAAIQRAIDDSIASAFAVSVAGMRWREIDFPEDLFAARAMFSES